MLGPQAPGADVKMLGLAFHRDSRRMDIGYPAALGMALGVAHGMTKLRYLPAYIALQDFSPSDIALLQNTFIILP